METVKTNRKYKSRVFTALFGEKESLLELYNAIMNTNYGKDTDIVITTLEDASARAYLRGQGIREDIRGQKPLPLEGNPHTQA